MQKPDYFQQ